MQQNLLCLLTILCLQYSAMFIILFKDFQYLNDAALHEIKLFNNFPCKMKNKIQGFKNILYCKISLNRKEVLFIR